MLFFKNMFEKIISLVTYGCHLCYFNKTYMSNNCKEMLPNWTMHFYVFLRTSWWRLCHKKDIICVLDDMCVDIKSLDGFINNIYESINMSKIALLVGQNWFQKMQLLSNYLSYLSSIFKQLSYLPHCQFYWQAWASKYTCNSISKHLDPPTWTHHQRNFISNSIGLYGYHAIDEKFQEINRKRWIYTRKHIPPKFSQIKKSKKFVGKKSLIYMPLCFLWEA